MVLLVLLVLVYGREEVKPGLLIEQFNIDHFDPT
jgi:hypothetical protein